MKMVRRTFILGPAILCVLFVSLHTAYSQSVPPRSYLFVEVQDPTGKPVADASVSISNANGEPVVDVWTNKVLNLATNKGGTVESGFLRTSAPHYDLQISKSGYLPSEQVFFPRSPYYDSALIAEIPHSDRNVGNLPIKIQLLPTPVTPADRQAVEAAEQKHQFLLAAKRGDSESVRKLLHAGVRANTTDAKGVPAIAWAAFAGDPATIKELLAAGANVRNRNSLGHHALLIYLAEGITRARYGRKPGSDGTTESEDNLIQRRQEIVRGLIEAGAGINVQDSYRGTVLNRAIEQAPYYLSIETIRVLIAAGAQVNASDQREVTPLMLAAQKGSYEMIRMLFGAGAKASINAKDKDKETALIKTVARNGWSLDTAAALIAAGAEVNVADKLGQTPLIFAIRQDSVETIKFLLVSGAKASINAKDKDGQTALLNALIGRNGSFPQPNPTVVKALIAGGANINDVDASGQTPLMAAARANSIEVIKLLLEVGAGASINAKDQNGQTALMYAGPVYYADSGSEVVKALLAAGANVDAVDRNGQTALMLAVASAGSHSQTIEKIKLLLAARADVHIRDNQGQTALMIARKAGDQTIIRLIEEAEARR